MRSTLPARSLVALREVAHAVLTAEHVEDALQFTLERVSPLVHAAFASVYLTDGQSELLRLTAAYNWPEKWRPWLGEMRVRLGFGPSGEAASERRVIEVADVFADSALEDWREVARELGFSALIALPLSAGTRCWAPRRSTSQTGAGSRRRNAISCGWPPTRWRSRPSKRDSQSEPAGRHRGLPTSEAELERQTVAALEAGQARDEFLANVSHELKTPLTVVLGTIDLLTEELGGPLTDAQHAELRDAREASERLLGVVETLLALSALRRGSLEVSLSEFDPCTPLREAVAAAGSAPPGVEFVIEEPPTFVPLLRGDREKTTRILVSLIVERIHVHGPGNRPGGARGFRGPRAVSGAGHGHRHFPGCPARRVRRVSPSRRFGNAALCRHGTWLDPCARPGAVARRRHRDGIGGGGGKYLYAGPAVGRWVMTVNCELRTVN